MMGMSIGDDAHAVSGPADGYQPPDKVSSKYAKCVPGNPSSYSHLTEEEKREWSEQLRADLKSSLSKFF